MIRRIHFGKSARKDISHAKEWHAEQDVPDLDLRFRRELEALFEQIEAFPESFPVVYKDVRRASLKRFPYAVFYHSRSESLFVLGVVHHARHPHVWQRRR